MLKTMFECELSCAHLRTLHVVVVLVENMGHNHLYLKVNSYLLFTSHNTIA